MDVDSLFDLFCGFDSDAGGAYIPDEEAFDMFHPRAAAKSGPPANRDADGDVCMEEYTASSTPGFSHLGLALPSNVRAAVVLPSGPEEISMVPRVKAQPDLSGAGKYYVGFLRDLAFMRSAHGTG